MSGEGDFEFWWSRAELYDLEPAFLLCGLEPESGEPPPRVDRVKDELLASVPYEERRRPETAQAIDPDNWYAGTVVLLRVVWRTAAVRAWGEANGYLDPVATRAARVLATTRHAASSKPNDLYAEAVAIAQQRWEEGVGPATHKAMAHELLSLDPLAELDHAELLKVLRRACREDGRPERIFGTPEQRAAANQR